LFAALRELANPDGVDQTRQFHVAHQRTNVWRKACRQVSLLRKGVFNQRNDFQQKLSREIINAHGIIAVEDLNMQGFAKSKLAKSVQDSASSAFIAKLAYKAESAGRWLVKVDPRGTSQQSSVWCLGTQETLQRDHQCTACGLETTRDHASALEILRRGLCLVSATPALVGVLAEALGFNMGCSHFKDSK
jgi:putative transposase